MSDISRAVRLTQALVREDTVNPPGNEVRAIGLLAERLGDAGFDVTISPFGAGRASLIARIGSGGRPLAFTGHVDTVPLGARQWSVDPWGGEIAGDRLFGRGASDMKSGVAAFTEACIAEADRLRDGPGALLIVTAAEETGSEGAQALVAAGLLPEAGALVVAEPTANQPYAGHKGALWLKMVAHGVTAHGSMPEHGVNAVLKAARAVLRLEGFDLGAGHAGLGRPTLNVGTLKGGLNINSVPDLAEAGIDIRTLPGQDHRALCQALADWVGDEVALQPLTSLEAVWSEPVTGSWSARVFAIMADLLGVAPTSRGASYFTDASVLAPAMAGLPTVILGPGEPQMAHQTDEYCLVSRIDQVVEAYRLIIRDWCA